MRPYYFLRHAQSAPTPDLNESEWPLSPAGQQAAESLIPILQALNIHSIFCSPAHRTQATVRPFAQTQKLSIALCDWLVERRVSPNWIENFMEAQARSWKEIHWKLPGGESAYEGQLRMISGVKKCLEQQTGPLLFVDHGNAIALNLRSLSPEIDFEFWHKLPMPALIEVHPQEIRQLL